MSDRQRARAAAVRPARNPSLPSTWRRAADRTPWLAGAAVFAFGLLAYANTLGHGFVWDDPIWLEQKIRFYRSAADAFFEPRDFPMRQVYRPLSQLTYWLDQSVWWRNPFGFHLTSIVLHALNGVLVLGLASALGLATGPAVVGALLFVVHPIQPESVAWITNRVDVLATGFVLVAILASLRPPSAWTVAIVAVASFAAAASKETGCVVPLLLFAATATLISRGASSARSPSWVVIAASIVGVLGYFALRPADAGTGIAFGSLELEALVQLTGSFGYQVERLLWPIGFQPYVAAAPTDPMTLGLAASGAIVTAAGLVAPASDGGRRRFALLWILIAAALPVVVVLADFSATPVAEHRLYLATVGLALLVALTLERRPAILASRSGVIAIGLGLVALTATTTHRNAYWRDELTLWSAVTERVQTEPLPYLNLGLALANAGRQAEAEPAYRRALALAPTDVTRQRASINLGLLLVDRGALDEAQELLTQANQIAPHATAYRGLGMIARRRAQVAVRAGDVTTASAELNRARTALDRALAINPRYYQARFTLAGVLYDAGQYRGALAQYQRVVELAGDTDTGREAAAAAGELSAWLAAHPEAP